ncbi:MAG: type IV pili twitching motility protein PilT, partial [Acidimicrobiia bacterium]|nr:type IV pili twitching motility protein PilT [Acidimicrobiia bacterium]
FDQSIMELLRRGEITYDEALANATSPSDFKIRLQTEGLADRATA